MDLPPVAFKIGRRIREGIDIYLLHAVIFFFDRPVTIAGEIFQPFAVENGNHPARVSAFGKSLKIRFSGFKLGIV